MNLRAMVLLIVGFLVAPLVPAIVLASQSPGLGVTSSDPISLVAISALLYLPASALTAVFGIPIFAVLLRYHLIRWWSALASGFTCGALLGSIFTGFRWLRGEFLLSDLPGLLVWAACGAIAGLIIWLSWIAGLTGKMPNNSFKPNPHQGGA